MSGSHDSDLHYAAGLLAQALLEEAARSTAHRRLLLRAHLGVPVAATHEALAAMLDSTADVVVGSTEPVTLQAIRLPGDRPEAPRLLVPYLVLRNGTPPGPNSGSDGFAALLRDEVPTGPGLRVLLILDDDPVETVRTSAADAAELPALGWEPLCRAATTGAGDAVRPLLAAVLRDDSDYMRLPRTASALGALRHMSTFTSAEDAGAALHTLGCYVSDPSLAAAQRLRQSAKYRDDLDGWLRPDVDFEAKLATKYAGASPGLARVRSALTPLGLDYGRFNYDDLWSESRPPRPLRLAYPLVISEAARICLGHRALVWKPGGGDVGLALSARAGRDGGATVVRPDGAREHIPVRSGDSEVQVSVPTGGWHFLRLEVGTTGAAELAIWTGTGAWAPFEASLDIDVNVGAFAAGPEPRVLALGPNGELAGQPVALPPSPDPGTGAVAHWAARLDSEEHTLPLALVEQDEGGLAGDEELPADLGDAAQRTRNGAAGEAGPAHEESAQHADAGSDADEDLGDAPADGGGALQAAEVVPSAAHALLQDASRGRVPGSPTFLSHSAGGVWVGSIGTPQLYQLDDQELGGGLNGLHLERLVLDADPDVLAFNVVRTPPGLQLEPHPYLQGLSLDAVPGAREFRDARKSLFAALRPAGSAHAIACGVARTEAEAYVEAYRSLLANVVAQGRFRSEYELILLTDAIEDIETGQLLVAPTSPLAVAFLLALADEFSRWHPRAGEVLPQDRDACSPRHLLPYFSIDGTWYEVGGKAPLLWRRYRPTAVGAAGGQKPRYIRKRIERFIGLHPEYGDPRQTLSLSVHEPGDGTAVLEALRELADGRTEQLPRLRVTVVSATEAPTVPEALVSGQLSSPAKHELTDRLLRDRLEVRRAAPGEGMPPFAHLTFVFESTLRREPATVSTQARATTLFAGGLAAVPGRHIEPGANDTTFLWGTFVGSAAPTHLTELVRRSLEVVGGMPRDMMDAGTTRMPSLRIRRHDLDELYRGSAWVVHLDKLLGLEAFAPDASGRRARYVIDSENRLDLAQPGLDAITATDDPKPYRRALRQALAGMGRASDKGLDRLLQLFNGVSGQWALDLIGAQPNRLQERIGLAAAVASVLDVDGGLHGDRAVGVILPLDEVLRAVPGRPSPGEMCDDLLYVRIPTGGSGPLELRGRLLEVKFRGSADPDAAETARRQLERAHSWLDSTFNDAASPGRAFRSRDLCELLRAAATRLSAFDLMSPEQRATLEPALDLVAGGQFALRLDFTSGADTLLGDYVSIEGDSEVPVHRQPLAGDGLPLGHLRLGAPALKALAAGDSVRRPAGVDPVSYEPPEDPGGGGTMGGSPGPVGTPRGPATESAPPGGTEGPRQGANPERGAPASGGEAGARSTTWEGAGAEVALYAPRLDAAFAKYGLTVEPFQPALAQVGPSLLRFRTRTLGRLAISAVEGKARDLGREIASPGAVGIGDEPGFVTVDVPRSQRQAVPLQVALDALRAERSRPGALNFVAGVAPSGRVEVADLTRLPHLLVAGATGSGKSVFLRGLLIELLQQRSPEQLSLLIIDPKRLDFAAFARAPHVRGNAIISDAEEALDRLRFTLQAELDLRQPILEEAGVSSATEYYEAGGALEDLPQLVILVDEFADLVLAGSDRKAFSELVQRYAQLTRAYGIFLVLATQRPSVDVVTGSIKANLSARIAFSLPSGTDSRTVLDRNGAEDLLGDGDMLFYRNGRVDRLQAPFASSADVRAALE